MPRLIQNCSSACGLIGHTDKVCGMKLGRGERGGAIILKEVKMYTREEMAR